MPALSLRRERWRNPRAVPLAAAAVMGLLGLVEAASDPGFRPHLAALSVTSAWIAAGFVIAARWPAAGAVMVAWFYPLSLLLGAPGPGGTGLIAVLVATAWAGYAAPRQRSLLATALCIGTFVVTDAIHHGLSWDTVFFPAIFIPAWWTGTLVQREQARSRQVLALAAELDAQREAAAHSAVLEERSRIAREVHDAVAHSVSVMTLQIGGLRRQLDDVLADRPAEREVMLGLERLGRQSVEELRATVGILRESGSGAPATAPPSLVRVEELAADVRAAGLNLDLELAGDLAELPRALDVAAYRIAQEALTNVLRHAPAAATTMRISHDGNTVRLSVTDDGAGGNRTAGHGNVERTIGGHGLVGMRERAEMFGGTLEAGPRPDGGFAVQASFPVRGWS
jgi:signal transduction histidine kinase